MDADHELDHADVTEASQMISALVQMGYTKDKAQNVYTEIGKYVVKNLQTINTAIADNTLYELFGKALIQSFASGDKETLGLAQSFIKLANKSLSEGNFNYRIPLSSSSINGLFNSAVTVELIRKAIRRHYDGVGAVLNPSHGMIQTFNIDGKNYTYDELAKLIDNDPKYEYNISTTTDENGNMYVDLRNHRWSLNDLINLVYKDGNLNPTIQPIQQSDIDFEDTIVIFDADKQYEVVKIDSYEKYQYYKNVLDTNNYSIYN